MHSYLEDCDTQPHWTCSPSTGSPLQEHWPIGCGRRLGRSVHLNSQESSHWDNSTLRYYSQQEHPECVIIIIRENDYRKQSHKESWCWWQNGLLLTSIFSQEACSDDLYLATWPWQSRRVQFNPLSFHWNSKFLSAHMFPLFSASTGPIALISIPMEKNLFMAEFIVKTA